MTIAPPTSLDTDGGVPLDPHLTQHHQAAAMQHRLGRIGAAALAAQPAQQAPRPELRLVAAGAELAYRFPCGAQTRRVDVSGRVKLYIDGRSLSDEFGWQPGGLDAVLISGWLVITQPDTVIRTPRDRCGSTARFTVESNGVERVTLRPAHLSCLALSDDRNLLLAAIPAAQALVVVNPAVCLTMAPGHVTDLLEPTHATSGGER